MPAVVGYLQRMGGRRREGWLYDVVPDGAIPLFAMFALQTMAVGAMMLVFEQGVSSWGKGWLVLLGVVLFVMAAIAFAWRERVRKKGTAIAVVVRRDLIHWEREQVIKTAREFQRRERFLHFYPLVEVRPLPVPAAGQIADWSSALQACKIMLRVVLDRDAGAPADLSRVALAVNAPLPVAFQLGAEWEQIGKDLDWFELVTVRHPDGREALPYVAWRSTHREGKAEPTSSVGGPLVFVLMKNFDTVRLEHLGSHTLIGQHGIELDENSQPLIEDEVARLRAFVRAAEEPVDLILATTAAVAFVVGYRLHDLAHRIQLFDYHDSVKYYPVSFDPDRSSL